MARIRVLIADDHAVLRAGLRLLLDGQPDLEVVGEAGDAAAALSETAKARPDVVVLDLSMPGGGTALIARIRESAPSVRVVVLTMYDNPSYLRDAIASGAHGFLSKSTAGPDLVTAIRSVSAGRSFFAAALAPPQPGGTDARARPKPELSPRELEVLKMVAGGHTNKEVANVLGISVKTVETHRARLAEKAGLKGRAQFVRYALDLGLIGPGRASP